MDEVFQPLHSVLRNLAAVDQGIYDPESGISTYISEITIETPIELDISWDESGNMQLGTIPPLYRIETTYQPSYHNIKFNVCQNSENGN